MRIFVTGATGVLGRRAVPRLVAAGHRVTAMARTTPKADALRAAGAEPVRIDLFDPGPLRRAVAGHDAIAHLATAIPTGASSATPRGWASNDRLRAEGSARLCALATELEIPRFVQESVTFPYLDGGDQLIDETHPCDYYWANRTARTAEANVAAFTARGGDGVVLRFAMFFAPDSAHVATLLAAAGRGVMPLLGRPESYFSFVHADDAARAVVAALEAPAGVYNVAEGEPATRHAHALAMAAAVGRRRLRIAPRLVERLGGAASRGMARSHRIDTSALQATGWSPEVASVTARWATVAG